MLCARAFRKTGNSKGGAVQLRRFGLKAGADLGTHRRKLVEDIKAERPERDIGLVAQIHRHAVGVKDAHCGQGT